MRVAVIGRGLAGLGVGWHLLQRQVRVTFFDASDLKESTSAAATGLVHPYAGEQVRRSWRATNGLFHLEQILNQLPAGVLLQRGILRITTLPKQALQLKKAAHLYGDVQEVHSNMFLISSGLTLDTPLYLQELFAACLSKGAQFIKEKIDLDRNIDGYDATVFACGAAFTTSPFASSMLLSKVKGQSLQLRGEEVLKQSCVAKGHLSVTANPHTVILGSTYEREYTTESCDHLVAQKNLLPKLCVFSKDPMHVMGCKAGIRLVRKNSYIPYVDDLGNGCYWMGAMGSRGLLYHAYLGSLLAEAIIQQNALILPSEVRR